MADRDPAARAGQADRRRLLRRLRAAGLAGDEIAAAQAEGRLPTLAVEVALGGGERHTLTDVARRAGVPTKVLREVMQALGRPNPARRERAFTDEDVEAALLARRLLDAGFPQEELLEVGRVMSQGMAQLADAVRRSAGDALLRPGDSEETAAVRFAEAADALAPLVPSLLAHQFRAHLREGIRRQLLTEAEREAGRLAGTTEVAVAFADLVDYTRLGERLPPEDLGRIAGRLTELAAGSARRPVRLVKTIGDAAMFVSPQTQPLLDTLTRLVGRTGEEGPDFPSVRVGVAHGPATARGGDWYGAVVNVASRVTHVARPGRILATEAVQRQAPELGWRRRRRRSLKGVDGRLRLFELAPAQPA
jgi:adenylate cyclase